MHLVGAALTLASEDAGHIVLEAAADDQQGKWTGCREEAEGGEK